MSENKFSKFAVNYLDSAKTKVYNYTALDEANEGVLVVQPFGAFNVKLPCSMYGTCVGNFNSTTYFDEITEETFWKAFKSLTLQTYQYYQQHAALVEQ